jgi:hypothetical protein
VWGYTSCSLGIGYGVVVMFGRLFRVPAASYGNVACYWNILGDPIGLAFALLAP